MSDFLYIDAGGIDFEDGLEAALLDNIRSSLAETHPRNLLLKARIIIRKEQTGISIERLLDDRIRGDVLTHIVHWASQRSSAVSIRLEGHRGKNPLPAVDRRTGSIDDVLKIRRFARKPYRIDFELR